MSDIRPNGPSPKADWSDDEWAIFETWVRGVLVSNSAYVSFTKKDGTLRTLHCTLDPNLLPPVITESKKTKSSTSIAAFDLDLNEWRAFRIREVKSITFSIGEPEPWPFPTGQKP